MTAAPSPVRGSRRLLVACCLLGSLGAAGRGLAARGGPDAFGYTWRDDREPGVAYQRFDFRPPPTDVFVAEPGPDGSTAFLPLPFPFPFYGQVYRSVSVSEDGWLSFADELASDPSPSPLPDPDGPRAMVAALWEDLAVGGRGLGDFIRYQGDAQLFVLEWFRTSVGATGEDATFQVWLRPDGTLRVQYLNVAGDHPGVTIGLESEDGLSGIEVVSAGAPVDGFAVRPQSAVEFLPPSAASCARVVGCDESVTDAVRRNPDVLDAYAGCAVALQAGAEALRTLELTELTHLTAQLASGSALNELFLLPECTDLACLSAGDLLQADFLPPGRYVLAVDSADSAGGGPFTLDVGCEPALIPTECGVTAGTLGGAADRISSWTCLGGDSSGPERLHLVTLAAAGDLVVELDRPDLQVTVSELAGFPNDGARCLSAGVGRTWVTDLPAGMYVVAVDGPPGASGEYALTLGCDAPLTSPLACGDTLAGSLPAAGRLDGYACGSDLPGGEALFEVTLASMATLVVRLETADPLSLLLLDGRAEGPSACVARSDDGFLSYPNARPGPHVIAVDGPAGGDFMLTVECQEPVGRTCTPWERHDGDVPITGLNFFAQHGQVEMYELATPPPPDDPGWRPAPDPATIGYAQGSAICGHDCLAALDFTYFRSFVRLPQTVTTFEVSFSRIDDGVEVRLNGQRAGIGFLGTAVTVDLTTSPAMRPGELNEVLLVQVDDCCSWTELSGTACVVIGSDPPCRAEVTAPPDVEACGGERVDLEPAAAGVSDCFDVAEYRWSSGARVLRDWDPDPRLSHVASHVPETLTVEVRCRRDHSCTAEDDVVVRPPGDLVLPDVNPHLRVAHDGATALLSWTAADVPALEGHFHVYRRPAGSGVFALRDHARVAAFAWSDALPGGRLVLYDVRSADGCERQSAD